MTLGWILSEPIASFPTSESISALAHHGVIIETLDRDLRRFWEIEEVPQEAPRSPEEHQCEEHFKATHSRISEGRYIVRLPFKNGPSISRRIALYRHFELSPLGTTLIRDSINVSEYREFLAKYETLDHMLKSPPTEIVRATLLHSASCCLM